MSGRRDGWQIVDDGLPRTSAGALESVFAVANGYLGLRGAPEEGFPAHDPGVILNGFHETWPIHYPEDAYGLARTGQTIADVPDGSIIRLFVDDEPVDLTTARVLRHVRVLDLRAGVLRREVEFETNRGQRLLLLTRRLASFAQRHVVAVDYEVASPEDVVDVTVSSELLMHGAGPASDDPRRGSGLPGDAVSVFDGRAQGLRATLRVATRNSGLELACGMDHAVEGATPMDADATGDRARIVVRGELGPERSLRLSKFVSYHWAPASPHAKLGERVERSLDRALADGYDGMELAQRRHVKAFWDRSDVEITGAPHLQRAVRFNLFQLLQATGRAEGHGVAAKGVTGRGYEGQYFWDTETYVVPFLMHTTPTWAKRLLEFRCGKLDAARERARETGHGGALFPWRTIDGREASAWYAAGTAQCHINADIAFAMHHSNRVTGDLGFMLDQGAEVLVETARFWLELGFFSQRRGGRFCINGVTGPDEYSTVVDNNAYTNLMAKENLEIAVRVVEWLEAADPEAHAALVLATSLRDAEIEQWRRAAALMYVPRHEELGIVLQDEHFLDRKRWDFDGTPPEKHPLLLHFHPLELYRHQVIKQTDVVLASYLVGHHFSAEEARRTFEYYDPLTTGDSTLSACIQSVMACATGHDDAALEYFERACTVDLDDAHGNTADGIHVASCAGTWLALVAGFGGLRDFDGDVHFAPRLPQGWPGLRFRVEVRGQRIEVDMSPEATRYRLITGTGIPIRHFDEQLRLVPGEVLQRAVERAPSMPTAASRAA